MNTPVELLLPFQRRVYADSSRWVAWISSRQIGKSFTGAAKAVRWANERARNDVLVASPSERQSLEAVAKCKDWARAFDFAIEELTEERDREGALIKSTTITFPNKSRIIAVPGKPETVRGFSANVWADEFAFFDDAAETWKALIPCVTNGVNGRKNVLITSTPNGKGGRGRKFWEIVTNGGQIDPQELFDYAAGAWSVHRTPITRAADALHIDIDELRAVCPDEAWRQEFMCEFIDVSNVLLSYDLISRCESDAATTDPAGLLDEEGEFFGGLDFGRFNDPTRLVVLKRIDDAKYKVRGLVTCRSANTVDQYRELSPYLAKCARTCVDFTGPGIGFGDLCLAGDIVTARTKDSEGFEQVELCQFTAAFKSEIFPLLKSALDGIKVLLPVDVEFREDLHEMQQRKDGDRWIYEARRTKDGHSDICTALALAVRATSRASGAACQPPERWPRVSRYRRGWM